MRLLRLKLTNWRGVAGREITFSENVTLVEGPNEIGKSTTIEAIQTLFRELDSSSKKQIKAIMPAGQDVGSRVEAEVCCGEYHFVFAKTYNRDRQTTLDILTPVRRQFSGREAHEEVQRILEASVDMALWEALLIDQGEKIGLADLKDSGSLTQALDEAAGTSGLASGEDSSLYQAIAEEYEKYYTPNTGRAKFTALEAARDEAANLRDNAADALAEVEQSLQEYQRRAAEVQRLQNALPQLQNNVEACETHWQRSRTLAAQAEGLGKQLESAQTILSNAQREVAVRAQLLKDISASETALAGEKQRQEPLRRESDSLQRAMASAIDAAGTARDTLRAARSALELAENDEAQLRRLERISSESERLAQFEEVTRELKTQLSAAAAIRVDDAGLERIRAADAQLAIARSRRDAAATTVTVAAKTALHLAFTDGTSADLEDSQKHSRAVASELSFTVSNVAEVTVTPSVSSSELAEQTAEAEATMAALIKQFEVTDLQAAIAENQRRRDIQAQIERLKEREAELLAGANIEEVRQLISSLRTECERYDSERNASRKLPEDTRQASDRVVQEKNRLAEALRTSDLTQERIDSARSEFAEVDARLRHAQQNLAGLEAALRDRQQNLQELRSRDSDEDLEERLQSAEQNCRGLSDQLQSVQQNLSAEQPEAALTRLENAKDVLARAGAELSAAEKALAVLEDRLEQARANGRFEDLEAAERAFDAADSEYQATLQRASAAELLWTTLNRHRDAAREAYVRPLKDAVERLGAIVFGAGFEVSIDEDWKIVSRTLNGRTLPFTELSVGAQEQLGLLSRLAAAQIVSNQGGVPLFIDDALGFSDPARLQTMGAAIAAAGRDAQIIILTCTPGRFMHVGNAVLVKLSDD